MTIRHITRRGALIAATTLPLARAYAQTPPTPLTDTVVATAKEEGAVVFHTSIEIGVAQRMIGGFNEKFPDIRVQLERTGAERILQRITQEYGSDIYVADVVESSDMGTFVDWEKKGWLATYVPPEVAEFWPREEKDDKGQFASVRASLSVLSYNSKQVKAEDAPKGFMDLLAPKWRMRMVKAHPSYSGSILTSTYATVQALGWDYMEKLAKQRVMQVQSAVEPPKKVAQGERSIGVDGSEYVLLNLADAGAPIVPIYAVEGTPIFSGQCAVMAKSPHPNAARVFYSYLFSKDCQQLMIDTGNVRSFHPGITEKEGHMQLSKIKLLRSTADDLAENAIAIKRKYAEVFGV